MKSFEKTEVQIFSPCFLFLFSSPLSPLDTELRLQLRMDIRLTHGQIFLIQTLTCNFHWTHVACTAHLVQLNNCTIKTLGDKISTGKHQSLVFVSEFCCCLVDTDFQLRSVSQGKMSNKCLHMCSAADTWEARNDLTRGAYILTRSSDRVR